MGQQTAIAWTDHTFNPWWGCVRVSPACDHCYAETFAKRTGNAVWGKDAPRRFFGDKHWGEPLKWNRTASIEGRRHRVFCASMADVFEARDDLDEHRVRLWDLIAVTPWLDWQLLTKRPEQVMRRVPAVWRDGLPPNVWIGTTVEDQHYADLRIPRLLDIPAAVRFLSCEPLLDQLDIRQWLHDSDCHLPTGGPCTCSEPRERCVDWVIVGGESGGGHRALDLDHARSLRDQVLYAHVPFFFKQVGGRTPKAGGDILDSRTWHQMPRTTLAPVDTTVRGG